MPLARDVVKDLAVEHGACFRPIQLRPTDLATGEVEPVLVPCGHTLASRLPVVRRTREEPPRRAMPRRLAPRPRAGHRTRRPHRRTDVADPDPRRRASRAGHGRSTPAKTSPAGTKNSPTWTTRSTTPGYAATYCPSGRNGGTARPGGGKTPRRCPGGRSTPARSARPTRRRTAKSSARPCSSRSLARPTGASRPMGRRPTRAAYDYTSAARDALHFAALFQVHAEPSPLRRIRVRAAAYGSRRTSTSPCAAPCSRAELREVIAATYHQVWWPSTDTVHFDGEPPARLGRRQGHLSRPGDRRTSADLGRGTRRHRRRRRTAARGPVR